MILIQRLGVFWYAAGLCALAAVLMTGCGSPGVPLPPSLELARPVSDLRAVRKGDQVTLTWTVPTRTTDGHNIRHLGATQICRSTGSVLQTCAAPIAEVAFQKTRAEEGGKLLASYTDQLSPGLEYASPTSYFAYAVTVANSYGRNAGLSNRAQVPAAPTLAAPTDFQAELTAEGVRLTWKPISAPPVNGVRFAVRVHRHDSTSNADSIAGEVPLTADGTAAFLDRNFEWEKTYAYRANVVTFAGEESGAVSVEGDDTASITIVAHDLFPPAQPAGLQAVFSGPGQKPFIDLVWTPNIESDVAGYNVYRRDSGGPLKLNSELVKAPAFRDEALSPGHTYTYSVSAVDLRGNESPKSEEASETTPPSQP
jgi:hypothetical protein